MTSEITALIVDDHEVVREGLRLSLSRAPHIRVVGEAMQVRPNDIKGDRRQQGIARARQTAMSLTRKITGLSYPAIGERFGGKDHSTVINAEQRITQLMDEDTELRATVESLLRRLNG